VQALAAAPTPTRSDLKTFCCITKPITVRDTKQHHIITAGRDQRRHRHRRFGAGAGRCYSAAYTSASPSNIGEATAVLVHDQAARFQNPQLLRPQPSAAPASTLALPRQSLPWQQVLLSCTATFFYCLLFLFSSFFYVIFDQILSM
jgi:hypothetical protein